MVSLGFSVPQLETDLHFQWLLSAGWPSSSCCDALGQRLRGPFVLMTFQSEVLPQPSCISGPELPVCESQVFGRAHIRKSGEAVRQSAADGGVQSSCLAGAGIIISMGIPKGALVVHQ